MKKFCAYALLLIALPALVFSAAPQKAFSTQATFFANDSAPVLSQIKIVQDYPTESQENGKYFARLKAGGKTLFEARLFLDFFATEVGETPEQGADLVLPYDEQADAIELWKEDRLLLRKEIPKQCNENGKCDAGETYYSCPNECSSGAADGICNKAKDGECDPDCAKGADKDCSSATPAATSQTTPAPTATPSPAQAQADNMKILLGAGAILFLALLFFMYSPVKKE